MGTIAELLGYSLGDPRDPDTPDGVAALVQEAQADASPTGAPTTDEVVLAAVLEETALDPVDARGDLTLTGDLDLDELGRWAVATALEHDLHATFTDADVESWMTLDDLLVAARTATATAR